KRKAKAPLKFVGNGAVAGKKTLEGLLTHVPNAGNTRLKIYFGIIGDHFVIMSPNGKAKIIEHYIKTEFITESRAKGRFRCGLFNNIRFFKLCKRIRYHST